MYRGRQKHFRETIFYKTSATYRPYVVTEKADLFVLSALMPALFSQSDIRVEGTLSSDLKYALENGLIYILAKTYGVRPIKVHAERIETFEFGGKQSERDAAWGSIPWRQSNNTISTITDTATK